MKPLYRVGDEDPRIADVQRRLLAPVVDGVFSEELATRVRGYQYTLGLPVSGSLDEMTLGMLLGGGA